MPPDRFIGDEEPLATSTLTAHAAFFVDDAPLPDFGTLLDRGPLLAAAGGVTLALVVWAIASICADPRRERCAVRWLSEIASGLLSTLTSFAPIVARVALGATLVTCAAVGAVGTPNLRFDGGPLDALRGFSAVLGVALVLGLRTRLMAAVSIATFVIAAYAAGSPIVVFERLDVIGLAVFVAIVGGDRLETRMDQSTLARLQMGTAWLRALLAGGLLVVAVTEKLANVPMTAQVLQEHPRVNLGLLLGTDATQTVLLLGAVEVAFALLVLLLPLPELLALAIGAPFVLTVGEFGLLEVPGHLPVWGAVGVLALLGAHVQTADLVTIRPPWLRGARRTPDAARVRLVGARVPWVSAAPVSIAYAQPKTIVVGSVATVPVVPVSASMSVGPMSAGSVHTGSIHAGSVRAGSIPAAPALAPQVAAWLGREDAQLPAVAQQMPVAVDEPTRFAWAPAAGAGVGTPIA
ncbi:MAG: hypothetical protein JWL76_1838 [Thermoleophilia bacterium]|nr:hypothetical protein [Thermoleophilia bacterium]